MAQPRLVIPTALPELKTEFLLAADLFGTPLPLMKAFAVVALREVDRIFKAGGDPPWHPLAVSTRAAKRQGKGSGSPMPLAGLRRTFETQVTAKRMVLYSTSGVSVFHEYGTKGPYKIEAKNGKALALPFLPGRDGGSFHEKQAFAAGGLLSTKGAGKYSLSGLGRSTRNARGSFTYLPTGKREARRFKGRTGKTVVAYTKVAFYQSVMHPGLHKRPLLPTPEQITPKLKVAATTFLMKTVLKRMAQ